MTVHWNEYVSELAKFTRLGDLPAAERPSLFKDIERRLIDSLSSVVQLEGQHATILEQAVVYGSKPLIDAIAPMNRRDFAQLNLFEWQVAARNCTAEMLRTAIKKGLIPPVTWDIVEVIFSAAKENSEMRNFLRQDVARRKWFFSAPAHIHLRWLSLKDSSLAADFLNKQVEAFPEEASKLLLDSHSRPGAILQLAGASNSRIAPHLPFLIDTQETAHEKIEITAAFSSLDRAHSYLRSQHL